MDNIADTAENIKKSFTEGYEEKSGILLIEDEEKLARFVELELCYEGYAVSL